MITKQKIRQKQLAFSLYFKQRNRHSSEITRFYGGGPVCSHQPQTTPPLPPPPPLWTIITKQKIRQKQLAFSLYFKQSNRRSSETSLKKGNGKKQRTFIYHISKLSNLDSIEMLILRFQDLPLYRHLGKKLAGGGTWSNLYLLLLLLMFLIKLQNSP